MKQYDDIHKLALSARSGDREALSCLVDTVRLRLFSIAFSISKNYSDAQDAVANAIVEICLHIGDLKEPRGVGAWMSRIVRREAYRINRNPCVASLTGDEVDLRLDAFHSMLRVDVERALHQLPVNQAKAIELFYYNTLSLQEIASEMSAPGADVNVGQVKVWLHREGSSLPGR